MIAPEKSRVALLVAGCFFMEMLDATIVTTSAPAIARSLSVPTEAVSQRVWAEPSRLAGGKAVGDVPIVNDAVTTWEPFQAATVAIWCL